MAHAGAAVAADGGVLERFAGWLAGLTGWRRRGMAALAGALAMAAMPPVHAVPLLAPGFCILVWMMAGQRGWLSAYTLGLWFGMGHHVAGLYWLAWPMTLDLARFGWMIPVAVFGMSLILAFFAGFSTLAAHPWRRAPLAQILMLAAAWGTFEWLRGNLFTGFPWNLLATAWTAFDPMAQAAALVGPYGLGVATVLIAALPAAAAWRLGRGAAAGALIAAGVLAAGLAVYGFVRLPALPAETVPGVRLRLVQGHVPQALKWAASERNRIFDTYIRLTRGPGFGGVTHVIWPETAVPYRFETAVGYLFIQGARRQVLLSAVPAKGALIAGTIRDNGRDAWNSVQVVTRARGVAATYDKHHLVPFGEYVPLRGLLKSIGFERLAHGRYDFAAGPGPRTVRAPGAPPFSPLICYEAIFPHEAAAGADPPRRPAWLLNVTNDAWFGKTSGPYQHLAAARLRAIEQGLPLVRAANTGVSVVTDAYGRIVARLDLGRRGVIDSALPVALASPTPYARWGDWLTLILVMMVALAAQSLVRYRSRH